MAYALIFLMAYASIFSECSRFLVHFRYGNSPL